MLETKFMRGVPTDLDVRRLEERFGIPEEDVIITWDEIEQELAVPKNSFRFKSVLTAWRKKLEREHNIIMIAVPKQGIKAANPDDRLTYASKKMKSGKKFIVRASTIATLTDEKRLTEAGKKKRLSIADVPNRIRLIESLSIK